MSDENGFTPGKSGNPAGKFQPGKSGNPGGKVSLRKDLEAAHALNPDLPSTPDEARAKWWATVMPVAFAGPQRAGDKNWAYASAEVGNRLLGKAKEHVELTGGLTPEQQALFEALRLTPHERRQAAQDSTAAEDDAALAGLVDADQ